MKLTKALAKKHQEAKEILKKDILTLEDKYFVLENYNEGGECNNKFHSAHFTPLELANDFKLEIYGNNILDLCAGIGVLSFSYLHHLNHGDDKINIVCVELNSEYVAVGKKILPEATWICGDVFSSEIQALLKEMKFSCVISNPPFGNFSMRGNIAPRYTGKLFEYALIDIASDLAEYGVFIIPQNSSPFLYSGESFFQDCMNINYKTDRTGQLESNKKKYLVLNQETGIDLTFGAGIDCSMYKDDWKGVKPFCEIVTCEFSALQEKRKEETQLIQIDLFAA